MQLLVVHHDAEVGEQLVQMVEDYTAHRCDYVPDDSAAVAWGGSHARCGLLLAQVGGARTDGLTLGGLLSETFPGLQTAFLPGYAVSEQRLEIANTKVFPEPINGELLLSAIERIAAAAPGAPDYFHALDVLQMCCLSHRSGALQMVRGDESGIVFLKEGRIVDADTATAHAHDALLQIGGWERVEFAYDGSIPAGQTISSAWDEALVEAVILNREAKAQRAELTAPTIPITPPAEKSPTTNPAPPKRGFFRSLRRSLKIDNG